MILIGLGSNLLGPWGKPAQTLERAFLQLDVWPLKLVAQSTIITSDPMGPQNQPMYANAVVRIESALSPEVLLSRLHAIERAAGRQRRKHWGPRTLDLDLLDYNGLVIHRRGLSVKPLQLPHPGITKRLFVLEPLREIAPRWRHPLTRETPEITIRKLFRLGQT